MQSIFREVNERIRELNDRFGARTDGDWVCECENVSCSERIELTAAEYELVRVDGNRFAIKPGHEVQAVEDVVERHTRYIVVSKHGSGGIRALEKDPRSG